jgi:DnaJ-class molecular chaperone
MADPFSTLGIPSSSTTDEARAAYRKLASKHHPDKGGNAEVFKEVKAAFESIEAGYTAPPPQQRYAPSSSFTKASPVYEGTFNEFNPRSGSNPFYRRPASNAYKTAAPKIRPVGPRIVEAYRPSDVRAHKGDFIAYVSISEAYKGFLCDVTVEGVKHRVSIPAGVPHGLRFTVPIKDKEDVTVITRFTQSEYQFVGVDTALLESTIVNSEPGKVYRTKDLWTTKEVHVKDLRNGTTFEMVDVSGQTFKVKIPAGHDRNTPLVVENHGYVDWFTSHSKAGSVRGKVYIRFNVTEEVPMSHLI